MEKENNEEKEIIEKKEVEDFSDIVKEITDESEPETKVNSENSIPKEEDKIEEKSEDGEEKIKKKHSPKWIVGIIVFIIVLLFLSTIFAIMNMNNINIMKGIYIENKEISGLTQEEVYKLTEEKIAKIEEVEVHNDDYRTVIKAEDIGLEIDGKDAIQKAISLGKSNNIIVDNYQILKTKLFKSKYALTITINEEKLKDTIKNIEAEMPGAMKEYSYEIEKDKLIITNGVEGKRIESEKFKQAIIQNIKEQFSREENQVTECEIPTQHSKPEPIDIKKIYEEIHKEAKNAYIIEEPFELHKEEDGIDFAISIEEAKKIVSEEKETYSIPLKITKAKVAVKDLGDKLFKQTLSKYTTIYDAGNTNRASNIALAAKTINGTILLPGETFSYNKVLGNTTKEKGYKLGGAYVAGKVVQAYGGGICQVSTTIYNAVLYANLEIVERHNHTYTVNYVPAGRDATVSYGGKDFRFKNSRKYPIKIEAYAKNGVIHVTIKGIKEEKEYEVVLSSEVLSTTPAAVTYQKNSNLAEGKEKVIQKGHSGQKSIAYKTIKYNGKTISKTVLSKDTYQPMNKIVEVGTKKVTVPANPTPSNPTPTKPEPTPEPTTQETSAPTMPVTPENSENE